MRADAPLYGAPSTLASRSPRGTLALPPAACRSAATLLRVGLLLLALFVGAVPPDCTARRCANNAVPGRMARKPANECALDAAFGVGCRSGQAERESRRYGSNG